MVENGTRDEDTRPVAEVVPRGLRVAAAVCWRLLVVAGAVLVLSWSASTLYPLVMSIAVAALLAALLAPVVSWLVARRIPRTLATIVVLFGGIGVVGGVLTIVITTVVNGIPELQQEILESVQGVQRWLQQGPLQLSQGQLDQALGKLTRTLRESQSGLASGAMSTAGALAGFFGGLVLVLFTLFFFLRDGSKIWGFTLRITVPASVRPRVDVAGLRAFACLVAYIRATAAVALMDALGIGVGTAIVGVPLSTVLAALVFLGAFVPYLGSMVAGAVAVLVAAVTTGTIPALVVLAIVVGVQQLEGNVLQPLILGHAVRLHPLAVGLGITAGFLVAGIAGAVLAVPAVAVLNAAIRSLVSEDSAPEDIDPNSPRHAQPGGLAQKTAG